MKRTIIAIVITAIVTSAGWYFLGGLRRGIEGMWLMSAVKAPGRMALDQIQEDLAGGHIATAKAEVEAFRREWVAFESDTGFRGQAIGNIMVVFSKLDVPEGRGTEPAAPADASQPVNSVSNQTSSAAGSRR